MISDQELADAIREKFPSQLMGNREHEEFGYAIHRFIDEHPAWRPTPGALAFDAYHLPVIIIGPHPKLADTWVVLSDDEQGQLATFYADELTPRAEQ